MRKLISLLLALAMVFSLAIVASAAEEGNYTDMESVTIDKTYTVTNEGTSYPNETFNFAIGESYTVDNGGVGSENQDMPTIGNVSFTTEDGTATKSVVVTLPTYTAVGQYSYTITEIAGDTAGVDYYCDTIKLVVTVIVGEDGLIRVAGVHTEEAGGTKSNVIENVYNAGSIAVEKKVTGMLGDTNKYFDITIILTGVDGKDYSGNVITVGRTSHEENPTTVTVGTPATFHLKSGETINLGNIPYGVTYTVTEADYTSDGYKQTIAGGDQNGSGTVDSTSENKVVVTNEKDGQVDTGITLDSIPFVLILAVCAGAAVLFLIKRRSVEF